MAPNVVMYLAHGIGARRASCHDGEYVPYLTDCNGSLRSPDGGRFKEAFFLRRFKSSVACILLHPLRYIHKHTCLVYYSLMRCSQVTPVYQATDVEMFVHQLILYSRTVIRYSIVVARGLALPLCDEWKLPGRPSTNGCFSPLRKHNSTPSAPSCAFHLSLHGLVPWSDGLVTVQHLGLALAGCATRL